jgi:acyl dehydratase
VPTKYGNDFEIGETVRTEAVTMTEAHILAFSGLTGDFHPLHVDAVSSAMTQFGQRLVHGPLVFGLAIGLLVRSGVLGDSSIAWLGAENVRMRAPVRIGDTLHLSAEVKALRPTSNPSKGVQTWGLRVMNSHNEVVLSLDHLLMVHMRSDKG